MKNTKSKYNANSCKFLLALLASSEIFKIDLVLKAVMAIRPTFYFQRKF